MKNYIHLEGLSKLGVRVARSATITVAGLAAGVALGGLVAFAAPTAAPGPVVGIPCSPGCDLYAVTGTISLPGAPVAGIPIWGYNTVSATVTAPGGPIIVVNEGDPVAITLHNVSVPSATSLSIAGQDVIPDSAGVTAGNSKTYSFAPGALKPGTYLYEAGLTADGPRQVAMGLYGALIVRPAGAPGQAYADSATAFDDEAVLVLSEIDPAFNADPLAFKTTSFFAKYWLINGKAYPNTDLIPSTPGGRVLLRYINAGLVHHSMAVSGLHQTIYATEAQTRTNPLRVVAQTIPAGGTLDTIVTMPSITPPGGKYALFEAAMHLDNAGVGADAIDFGGMLTFLTASGTGTSTQGPVTSDVSLSPNPSSGASGVLGGPVTLVATITASTGGAVDAAEYFVDGLGVNGSGCAISAPFTLASTLIPVSGATSPCVDLTTLTAGRHMFYVHGHNANGWGAFASASLMLAKSGPVVSGVYMVSNLVNGTTDVVLRATGTTIDPLIVDQAEYTIDGGAPVAMSAEAPTAAVSSLVVTIPAATTLALPEGNHIVGVRAHDTSDTWGAVTTATLVVDKTGPSVSNAFANPPATNGTTGIQAGSGGAFYVRLQATFNDPAGIAAAEYFVGAPGPNGTGQLMPSVAGVYSGISVTSYALLDMPGLAALSDGPNTFFVHAQDAAGNWGPTTGIVVIIDRVGPTTSNIVFTPVAANNRSVAVSASASDVATGNSNIAGGEFFVDTIAASGTGTAMTAATVAPTSAINGSMPAATVSALTPGNHTVYVHSIDIAGNWGPTIQKTLLVDRTAPTFTGITLNPTSIASGTASINLTLNGATDPLVGGLASGVVGGEYWFGNTNIAAGTGTQFVGTTNVPIATGALLPGTYTVRVRIVDAAGNYSTGNSGVRTATLTVTGPAVPWSFANGFETGPRPWGWSSTSTNNTGRLDVTAAALRSGTLGLQARGNNNNYVQYTFGANPVNVSTLDARFYFNPNNNSNTGGNTEDIFVGRSGGTTLFHVRYRQIGGQPQVQLQVGNTNNGAWVNITNNAFNYIEVVYVSGASLNLYVNGNTAVQTLSPGTANVDSFRLGSVVGGNQNTLEFFDDFSADADVALIGP